MSSRLLKVIVLMIGSICLCGCQGAKAEKENVLTFHELTKVSFAQGEEQVQVKKAADVWQRAGTADESIEELMVSLAGVKGKELSEKIELEGEPLFDLIDEQQHRTYHFYDQQEEILIVDEQGRQYQAQQADKSLALFNLQSLKAEKVFSIAKDELQEMTIKEGDTDYRLTPETSLSRIEQTPFISGWYLADRYHQETSVEYRGMTQILNRLANFKGRTITPTAAQITALEESDTTITLVTSEKEWVLEVGALPESGSERLVKVVETSDYYMVPESEFSVLLAPPIEKIDRFIALIPLSSLKILTVTTADTREEIEATHQLSEDGSTINSTFWLNGEELNEATFRKDYQKIAILSGESEWDESLEPLASEQPELTMSYTFLGDNGLKTDTIQFMPLQNGKGFAVIKNDVADFTIGNEQLATLLKVFQQIN